jgi:IS5 family transposase
LHISCQIHKFQKDRLINLGDDMISKTNPDQISIHDFVHNLGQKLDENNRWVLLAERIPWNKFREIYHETLRKDFGRPAKDARLVIGAMIIKHKKKLPDEEVIPEIQENPYLQFFVGLKAFTYQPIFDPSLFVTLRKRLGQAVFDELNQAFLDEVIRIEKELKPKKKSKKKDKGDKNPPSSGKSSNQGQLIIDASVAPQDIQFPTDLNLLNKAREHTERLIDQLWQPESGKRKPRTYRKIARKEYLSLMKLKRKSHKKLRAGIRKQLGYVERNIRTIKSLLEPELGKPLPFDKHELKLWWVLQELVKQQRTMYNDLSNSHPDRIVNLKQPHVRPIVRGKAGRDTEFGAKISCSLVDGFIYLDHLGWNAFNEQHDLKVQIENFKERFGYYPASVHADHIYGSHDNRRYMKARNIRYYGKALGRPPKLTKAQKKALKTGAGIRNGIEGKFGEGKRKYQLDCVKTKTQATSESWIAGALFVMNLAHWLRADFFVLCCKWIITEFQRLFSNIKEQFYSETAISMA